MDEDFTLDIAADLYGCKENLEVRFPHRPSLGELQAKTESLYQIEATVQRPPGESIQHIRVERFQIYDDHARQWRHLETCEQLVPYAQLYAFQETSADEALRIPTASPPRSRISVPAASPLRQRSPSAPDTLGDLRTAVQRSPEGRVRAQAQEDFQARAASRSIPGESLIQVERSCEETKIMLDIDAHRELIRRETKEFMTR